MKKNLKKNWCVQITPENRIVVRDFLKNIPTKNGDIPIEDFRWNTGSYYGILYDGTSFGSVVQSNVSKNRLSDEAFMDMMKNANTVDEYEMY